MNTPLTYTAIETALLCSDADEKIRLCRTIWQQAHNCGIENPPPRTADHRLAGRPSRPHCVPPRELETRKPHTREGYAALLHSICHIEYNAVNLALDAAWRFRNLPPQFTADWLKVAAEEAGHFELMRQRLRHFGFDYGSFSAHGGLWEMADKTAWDPLLRMALVPRVLEARGLDVTPAIREKIDRRGDRETCAVLDRIYRDEIGHVAVGNYWYNHLCRERGLNPSAVFHALLERYDLFVFRGWVNSEARQQAGFSEFELSLLEHFEHSRRRPQTA